MFNTIKNIFKKQEIKKSTAKDIAHYIIDKTASLDKPVSNLQLMSLLYLSQLQKMKIDKKPLFVEEITARDYGPMVLDVYYEYYMFGADKIYKPHSQDYFVSEYDKEIIDQVINKYIECEPWGLHRLVTNSSTAWYDVYYNRPTRTGLKGYSKISLSDIENEIEWTK